MVRPEELENRALDYGIANAERVLRGLRKRGGLNAQGVAAILAIAYSHGVIAERRPHAVVSPEVADAFGLRGLPNVTVRN